MCYLDERSDFINLLTFFDRIYRNQHYNARSNQTYNGQIIFHNCDFCGIEMQYFCWNCDKRMFMETTDSQDTLGKGDLLLKAIQRTPSAKQTQNTKSTNARANVVGETHGPYDEHSSINANSSSTADGDGNGACSSGNASAATASSSSVYESDDASNVISHSSKVCAVASDRDNCDSLNNKDELDVSDCRSCCKRQKTVHNYDNDERNASYIHSIHASSHSNNNLPISRNNNNLRDNFSVIPNVTSYDDASTHLLAKQQRTAELGECSSGSYRRTMSESVVGTCHTAIENCTQPGIDLLKCDMMNILTDNELKLYRRAYSEDELICNCDDNRPKQLDLNSTNSPPTGGTEFPQTPTTKRNTTTATAIDHDDHFKTPNAKHDDNNGFDNQTQPIYIDCRSRNDDERTQDALTLMNTSKSLPKINLNKLFAKSMHSNDSNCNGGPHELDISKELQKITQTSMPIFSFDFENLSPPLISPTGSGLVQKSNSAPSFQYSPPTLSPRFLNSAAATKRRSRHLSDRSSERLSIGSDDHLSDEEFHQYCFDPDNEYRPGISPTKATLRFFPKNYAYRKRALLGKCDATICNSWRKRSFLINYGFFFLD